MNEAPVATPEVPFKRYTAFDHFLTSCLWLAYNVQWGALLGVVLPSQITAIVGEQHKEAINGIILPVGALMALVVAPVAGALSDRSRHPSGRRRPFLIVGIIINVLALLGMSQFGAGSNIWLFAACYMVAQVGCNIWGGPYAGLIPDVVPPPQRAEASSWMAVMTAVGTIVGALAAGQIIPASSNVPINYFPVYLLIVVSIVVLLVFTLNGVRERPVPGTPPPFELGSFLRSFLLDPKEYRDFYWVLITRALVTMGIYSVFTFFQFFLKDIVHIPDAVKQSSFLIGIITAAGIPTAMIGGPLSDKHGRKLLVYISGGVMAVASLVFIGVEVAPSLKATFAVAALFGIGYGAYQAVDWAMAIDVLPGGEDAAKDMGIWHVAIVLPQIIAPAITGLTLNALKSQSLQFGYTIVFVMTAVWFILGTVFVKQIRGVR